MKICYLFRPRYLVSPYINAVCRLDGSVYYQPNRLPYGPARSIHERHKTWPENNYLAASHVISVIFNKIFTQVCNEAVRRMHMHEADVNRSVQGWHGYESLFVTRSDLNRPKITVQLMMRPDLTHPSCPSWISKLEWHSVERIPPPRQNSSL